MSQGSAFVVLGCNWPYWRAQGLGRSLSRDATHCLGFAFFCPILPQFSLGLPQFCPSFVLLPRFAHFCPFSSYFFLMLAHFFLVFPPFFPAFGPFALFWTISLILAPTPITHGFCPCYLIFAFFSLALTCFASFVPCVLPPVSLFFPSFPHFFSVSMILLFSPLPFFPCFALFPPFLPLLPIPDPLPHIFPHSPTISPQVFSSSFFPWVLAVSAPYPYFTLFFPTFSWFSLNFLLICAPFFPISFSPHFSLFLCFFPPFSLIFVPLPGLQPVSPSDSQYSLDPCLPIWTSAS